MKKYLIFIFIFFIIGCGYSPIYSTKKINNFNYLINNIEGDSLINLEFVNTLKRYKKNEGEKFILNINTKYSKKDLSKNLAGSITLYKITIDANIEIENNKFKKIFKLSENSKMQKIDNKFDEQNYENLLKKSLAKSMAQKLVFELSQIK